MRKRRALGLRRLHGMLFDHTLPAGFYEASRWLAERMEGQMVGYGRLNHTISIRLLEMPEDAFVRTLILGGAREHRALLTRSPERLPSLRVKYVNLNGKPQRGLFADCAIRVNTIVGEYIGIVYPYTNKNIDPSYGADYPHPCTMLGPSLLGGSPFKIAGTNELRLVNSALSGTETCNLDSVPVPWDGLIHFILIANRAIEADEQLAFDYHEAIAIEGIEPAELR